MSVVLLFIAEVELPRLGATFSIFTVNGAPASTQEARRLCLTMFCFVPSFLDSSLERYVNNEKKIMTASGLDFTHEADTSAEFWVMFVSATNAHTHVRKHACMHACMHTHKSNHTFT